VLLCRSARRKDRAARAALVRDNEGSNRQTAMVSTFRRRVHSVQLKLLERIKCSSTNFAIPTEIQANEVFIVTANVDYIIVGV
jgi:hypothetical protein